MSPFPLEAIDEVIWRIEEAVGMKSAPAPTRGWIKRAGPEDVVKFLSGLRDRLNHAKTVLTDAEHQAWLKKDGYAAVSVVLEPRKAKAVDAQHLALAIGFPMERKTKGGAE